MFRTVSGVFKKYSKAFHSYRKCSIITTQTPKVAIVESVKLLISFKLCCALVVNKKLEKMDVTETLHKALDEGEVAIINLLEQLTDFVKTISEEYRNCIRKQIEITEKASGMGQLSETWDELPQYRNLANELLKEINEYITLFNAVGEMAKNAILLATDANKINNIQEKYKELEKKIQKEIEENKKLEKKLLKLTCDCIVNDNELF